MRSRRSFATVLIPCCLITVPAFAQSKPPPPPEPATAPPPSQATAPAVPTFPPPPPTDPVPKASPIELTTLRLMLEKGIVTQAEYESALHDMQETSGARAADSASVVLGKWSTTMYGFVEADAIRDSTRSFNDLAGNAQVARAGTNAGDNARFTFGVRNSRIGFRIRAPEYGGVRASSMLEMDFLGTQLPIGSGQPYYGTEGTFFTSPTLRIRHFNFKIETPVVDILVGQYWQLFGWQSAYAPNTVEIQGVPGELYARTPQLRISKTLRAHPMLFEVAVAATRPFQRDSGTPDGQAGLRLALESWTGMQTVGATGTQISPLSVAVTGYVRRVMVDEFSANPKFTNDKTATGIAVDAFVPIIPATEARKGNSLSFNGEFATGFGSADFYTGLTGGIGFPALPNPMNANPAPTYTPDIDPGVATYDTNGNLHFIQWTSYLLGAQYYLPGLNGRMWVSGNFSRMTSDNMHLYGAPTKTRYAEDWADANLFVQPLPSVRVGLEFAGFKDTYVDGSYAINYRTQLSGFFIF